MRILVLGINYWPEETGIAPFTTGRCEYFALRGHQVSVVTAFPYYPGWRIDRSYRGRLVSRETHNGVAIFRSWLYVPRSATSARRIVHEASFVASASLRARAAGWKKRPDLVFVVSPPLGLAAAAMVLSRLWSVPYVLHVADLQPDAAVDLGMLSQGRFIKALYRLEAAAYRKAALVSTLTEAMRRRIIAKGVPAEKVALFSDWADSKLFSIDPPGRAHGVGAEGPFVVAHFGNMGVKQGLEVVLEAARLTRDDSAIKHLLVGDGAARLNLEAKARELNLPNLHFLPLQPRERFLELLARSDICLVTQQRTVADIVFPSKVITLLAAARPIIASVGTGSEIAKVIAESGGGIAIPPEDPKALADAVAHLRADPSLLARMGRAGRAYALDHWERETVLKSTERGLREVISVAGVPVDASVGADADLVETSER